MKSQSISFLLLTLSAASGVRAEWPGWGGIDYIFSFGDSYTTTGFDVDGKQPKLGNPLGNPAKLETSSNGPNWISYLTTKYNDTFVRTYNFAHSGATLDNDIIPPKDEEIVPSVKEQIEESFLPAYGKHPSSTPWESSNSLFTFFIGINDVYHSYAKKGTVELYKKAFTSYENRIKQLYKAGARNFLLVNVPPVHLSPLVKSKGKKHPARMDKLIEKWNAHIEVLALKLEMTLEDSAVFRFDAHSLYDEVLAKPKAYPETAGYKNTTDHCEAYKGGTKEPDTLVKECKIPVNEYFWFNSFHPTYPVHNLAARKISEMFAQKGFLSLDM